MYNYCTGWRWYSLIVYVCANMWYVSVYYMCRKQRLCVRFVPLWTDNKIGACGWSCQNHRTTGRKHSPTDGWQECGSGRRSRWERHKAFHTDWESVRFLRVLNCVVLPKHGLGRLRGAARGSPGRYRDSRWGSGGDLLLALRTRRRLRLRVMGNGNMTDLSMAGYFVNFLLF